MNFEVDISWREMDIDNDPVLWTGYVIHVFDENWTLELHTSYIESKFPPSFVLIPLSQ